jgi:3-dehydroquinate synthase
MTNWNTFYGPVIEGQFCLEFLDEWLKTNRKNYTRIIVLTDSNVNEKCLPMFLGELKNIGETAIIEIEPGESSKSFEIVSQLNLALLENNADRKSLLISLGGGVISDIGGFLSSIYMRGIDHIIVPTSLLSMIDASIGGKNGVNIQSYKNLSGTFSSSKGVFIYPNFLKSMNQKDLISGFSEIIKHAMLSSESLWKDCINCSSSSEFINLIPRAVKVKIEIVEKDNKERGNHRFSLNMGHTIAHAIEYFENNNISHGDAVAAGLWIESEIAFGEGLIDRESVDTLQRLIDKWWPRLELKNIDVLEGMIADKKKSSFSKDFYFSLWSGVGKGAVLISVPEVKIHKAKLLYAQG